MRNKFKLTKKYYNDEIEAKRSSARLGQSRDKGERTMCLVEPSFSLFRDERVILIIDILIVHKLNQRKIAKKTLT